MSNIATNSTEVAAIEALVQEAFDEYAQDNDLKYSILTSYHTSSVSNWVTTSVISKSLIHLQRLGDSTKITSPSAL